MKQDDPPPCYFDVTLLPFLTKKDLWHKRSIKVDAAVFMTMWCQGPGNFLFLNHITEQLQRDSPCLNGTNLVGKLTHFVCSVLNVLDLVPSQAGKGRMRAGKSVRRAGGSFLSYSTIRTINFAKLQSSHIRGANHWNWMHQIAPLLLWGSSNMESESPAFKCRSAKASVWTWWNVWRSCL